MYDISQLARSGRGLTRLGVAYVAIALGAGTAQFGVQAEEENARYRPQRAMAQPADTDHQRVDSRRTRTVGSSSEDDSSRLYVFRSPKGHDIMTNNPSKFRNRAGYTELDATTRRPTRPVRDTYPHGGSKTLSVASVRGIPEDIKAHVRHHARLNNLDESLVYAVIKAESGFVANARSNKGAQGLMQLMPATAAQMGVRNPYDAAENIRGGTRYLRILLDRFDNDLQKALAGYNAGPEKVKEYGGIPPYDETRNFVRRVIANRTEFNDHGVSTDMVVAQASNPTPPVLSNNRPKDYLVHFTSGHVQQAEKVVEDGDDLYITYKGRSFLVPKSLIRTVSQAS